MAGYGSYGQSNPYADSGNRYEQSNPYQQGAGNNPYSQNTGSNGYGQASSNPYSQQGNAPMPMPYGASATSGGRYDNQYQTPPSGPTSALTQQQSNPGNRQQMHQSNPYGNNAMEMGPMNGQGPGQGGAGYGQPGMAQAQRDPNAILNECREIDRGIDAIQKNLERLRFLQDRAINDPDASQGTATNRELDSLSAETMTLYRNFGGRIKAIKQQRESGEPRNRPQVGLVDRKLKQAINEYQQVDRDFRHKLSAQMERQYRIVRPEASDAEVREAVEDTSNNQVFSQALMTSNRRGQSQSALRAVQGRHEAIQKIERQMVELAQLFQDMEAAVIEQEPAVMDIEQKGEDTVVNLGKGNEHLDKAVVKARSARRKKWICLGISILILCIVAAVIAVVVVILKRR